MVHFVWDALKYFIVVITVLLTLLICVMYSLCMHVLYEVYIVGLCILSNQTERKGAYIHNENEHYLLKYPVRRRCNAVSSLPIPRNRHSKARPWGQDMECLLWVLSIIYVLLLSSQCRRQYRDELDRVIWAFGCTSRDASHLVTLDGRDGVLKFRLFIFRSVKFGQLKSCNKTFEAIPSLAVVSLSQHHYWKRLPNINLVLDKWTNKQVSR